MELELERTIFIISNTWKRRGSLNLRIDRRVMTDKLKASMPGFPESCSSLQTFRTDKYSRTCVIFLSNFWEFDLEGQNSDVSENGMVWGTCRWVFKILELLTLLGCFALLRRENEAELHQKEGLFQPRKHLSTAFKFQTLQLGFDWSKLHNYEVWLFY